MYDEGKLWVAVSIERNKTNLNDFVMDVFEDGRFLNRVKLDIGYSSEYQFNDLIRIYNNKLYVLNEENNQLDIYDINYIE